MARQTLAHSLIIQFPNSVQQLAYGAPVILSTIAVITDANGQALYQPTQTQQPADAEDITDELLEVINRQVATLGITVSRTKTK